MEPTGELFEQRLEILGQMGSGGSEKLAALSRDLADDPMVLCRASADIIQRRYFFDPTKMNEKRGDYCAVPVEGLARAEIANRHPWESRRI